MSEANSMVTMIDSPAEPSDSAKGRLDRLVSVLIYNLSEKVVGQRHTPRHGDSAT